MCSFHQFSAFAASRGEGVHPKLRALLERAAVSPFSEVSPRNDGWAGSGVGNRIVARQCRSALATAGRSVSALE